LNRSLGPVVYILFYAVPQYLVEVIYEVLI
jgi:hypothetical protein